MLFNEENEYGTPTDIQVRDTSAGIVSVDLDLDAAGDAVSSGNATQNHTIPNSDITMEEMELDSEDVDLDFDALNNQTEFGDSFHEGSEPDAEDETGDEGDVASEAIDLDFDALNHQTEFSDSFYESAGTNDEIEEEVDPLTFSENSVRIFQRSSCNLISESDFSAVMEYYNYNLTESECLEKIAYAHNLSEDSIKILVEANAIGDGVKKVKSKVSSIDKQIQAMLKKKSRMTPDQWKKGGHDKKLKQLRARKALSNG